jgi:tRNA(fMet)-specific endonuclease VapC
VNYLLDTNAVIALLKNRPVIARKRLRRAAARGASITVSPIVLSELWYGVARSEHRRENAGRLRAFLSGAVSVVPFDEQDAVAAGHLRATLESAGPPIGPSPPDEGDAGNCEYFRVQPRARSGLAGLGRLRLDILNHARVSLQNLRQVLRKRRARHHHVAPRFLGRLLELALHVREETDQAHALEFRTALEFPD